MREGASCAGSTALDVYLLPNTSVTLQSAPWEGSNVVIEWLTIPRSKQHLLGKNVKEKEITIDPMNEQLNHLVVYYGYKYNVKSYVFHRSSAAILHLFDNSFAHRQQPDVFSGKLPVFCLRSNNSEDSTVISSINTQILLFENSTDGSNQVRNKPIVDYRYGYRKFCLWIKSLQEANIGEYTMQIEGCFLSDNITFLVNVTTTGINSTITKQPVVSQLRNSSSSLVSSSVEYSQSSFSSNPFTSTSSTESPITVNSTRPLKDGGKVQGVAIWVIGITVFAVLLFIILVVGFVYKLRHRLLKRSHFDTRLEHTLTPAYFHTYDTSPQFDNSSIETTHPVAADLYSTISETPAFNSEQSSVMEKTYEILPDIIPSKRAPRKPKPYQPRKDKVEIELFSGDRGPERAKQEPLIVYSTVDEIKNSSTEISNVADSRDPVENQSKIQEQCHLPVYARVSPKSKRRNTNAVTTEEVVDSTARLDDSAAGTSGQVHSISKEEDTISDGREHVLDTPRNNISEQEIVLSSEDMMSDVYAVPLPRSALSLGGDGDTGQSTLYAYVESEQFDIAACVILLIVYNFENRQVYFH